MASMGYVASIPMTFLEIIIGSSTKATCIAPYTLGLELGLGSGSGLRLGLGHLHRAVDVREARELPLPGRSKPVESAALEAAHSSTRGSG